MDAVGIYLKQMGERPKFTREEEAELVKLAQAGDAEAMELLCRSQLPWVVKLTLKYRGIPGGPTDEDLIQLGNVGLLETIRRFDPTRGARLCTAVPWGVRQVIERVIQLDSTIVHMPATTLGDRQARDAHQRRFSDSLDFQPNGDGQGSLGAMTAVQTVDPGEESHRESELQQLRDAISALPDRLRTIMWCRLDGLTLDNIGEILGVTRERVRQLENKAMRLLRKSLTGSEGKR